MSENSEISVTEMQNVETGADPGEKLQQLESAYAELQQQYDALKNRSILEKVSNETGCTDPDYLQFCASRQGIILNDPEALRQFAAQLASVSPGCFRARITPGSSAGTLPAPASSAVGTEEVASGDRISLIALSIGNAPDAVCR